jgi:hypothetical protein
MTEHFLQILFLQGAAIKDLLDDHVDPLRMNTCLAAQTGGILPKIYV